MLLLLLFCTAVLLEELDDRNARVELEELETVALLVLLLEELDVTELLLELDELLDGLALLLDELLDTSISSPPTQTLMSTAVVALLFVIVMMSDAPPATA